MTSYCPNDYFSPHVYTGKGLTEILSFAGFQIIIRCGLSLGFDIVNKSMACAAFCFHPTYRQIFRL
jgi:hypothetical protein